MGGWVRMGNRPNEGYAEVTVCLYLPDGRVAFNYKRPKIDGHEVCRRVREQSWGKDIRIIALTGWGQDDDRRKSEEAGFNGHLVKPVDYDKLLALLG